MRYLLFLLVALPATLTAQIPDVDPICADRPAATGRPLDLTRPAPGETLPGATPSDLRCIDLTPTRFGNEAAGVISLTPTPSPFAVSVTADGNHRYALTAWIADLPDPASLGPFSTFVAWATPLELDPVVKLGEVGNGENELPPVDFTKFMILISAEPDAEGTERLGRLVLRGRSPSAKMEAHDLLAQAPSAERMTMGTDTIGRMWQTPPAYAGVPMLAGIMGLRPTVRPLELMPRAEAELEPAGDARVVELPNGGTLDLEAGFVTRRIGERDLTMLAFNGQHPGPVLKVQERSTIFVNFTNNTPMPTAVHWHGLRLDNRFDGVPGLTQDPVQPGETFRYELTFPDAGLYWYHPHHREDVQQELGLYGNMQVDPLELDYYNPVDTEAVLMLDDILLGDGIVPFGDEAASHALMGRFGNVMLINGETDYSLDVQRGEVVRFYFTNAANTRTFNLSIRADGSAGTAVPMKLVASDVSRFEHEEMVQSIVIAPAERYVAEVEFTESGRYELVNAVQGINHRMGTFLPERRALGTVRVGSPGTVAAARTPFTALRSHESVVQDIDRYRPHFERDPDHHLELSLAVDDLPDAVEQSMYYDWVYFNPVEWTGTMPMMNWITSGEQVTWTLRDPDTDLVNDDIDWHFRLGDVVKIRIVNRRDGFHVMQHPLHIHGQRFLVIEQNGVRPTNRVWKDTVLLPSGSTTDILLELSNPGAWMIHCHIAEHLEAGMKFVMRVERN